MVYPHGVSPTEQLHVSTGALQDPTFHPLCFDEVTLTNLSGPADPQAEVTSLWQENLGLGKEAWLPLSI